MHGTASASFNCSRNFGGDGAGFGPNKPEVAGGLPQQEVFAVQTTVWGRGAVSGGGGGGGIPASRIDARRAEKNNSGVKRQGMKKKA